jgi:diketogulonate reductase-like aldo/keto reductase
MRETFDPQRRRALGAIGAAAIGAAIPPAQAAAALMRPIPASSEFIPAIGMGTWITFNVGDDARARERLRAVLQAFFDAGGRVIDSSPMYGSAEEVVGELLKQTRQGAPAFAATKVWTPGRSLGEKQMEYSQKLWGVARFDLMQIHNLLDWETHVETLKRWKAAGRVRYIGITTSHGRRHEEMLEAMAREPFDFVQFTYNMADREAERRLLPFAQERRMAVIANRPFDGGGLFDRVRGKPLPDFAADFGCRSWAEYFLKFIVSHPAVTCAIPATSQVEHMRENMNALTGPLPDAVLRRRMAEHFRSM